MQAITNAIASLGEGKTLAEYEERAVELLLMEDRINHLLYYVDPQLNQDQYGEY